MLAGDKLVAVTHIPASSCPNKMLLLFLHKIVKGISLLKQVLGRTDLLPFAYIAYSK
jgi:hypothetical protein